MQQVIKNLSRQEANELFELSFGQGTMKADRVMDFNGDYYTRETLKDTCLKAKNGDIIGYVEEAGVKIPIKKNGAYSIAPNEVYPTVTLKNKEYNKYTEKAIRKENLDEARELFREYFSKNSDEIPETLLNEIKLRYPDSDVVEALKTMSPTSLKSVFESSGALHENLDGTVTFMPKEIHSKIGHMGGRALESWVKQHMGKIHFEVFISAAASGAVVGGANG